MESRDATENINYAIFGVDETGAAIFLLLVSAPTPSIATMGCIAPCHGYLALAS